MLTLTRRSFLKSLATLAASVAVPVEVSKTIDFLLEQPELPVTRDTPAGFISLNGVLLPLINASFQKSLGDVGFVYVPDRRNPSGFKPVGRRRSEPEWTIEVGVFGRGSAGYIERTSMGLVEFQVVPYKSNLKIEGTGYISQFWTESVVIDLSNDSEMPVERCSFEIAVTREPSFSCGEKGQGVVICG